MHTSSFASLPFKTFYQKLERKEKELFLQVLFFYYHRGWKFLNDLKYSHGADEGFVLLSIISVIEAIMLKKRYQEPFEWIKNNYSKHKFDSVSEIESAKQEYLSQFGISRAFKNFLTENLKDSEQAEFCELIKVYDESEKRHIATTIDQLGGLIYEMRSLFVHGAKYVGISQDAQLSFSSVNGKSYVFGEFQRIIALLERGVLRRFQSASAQFHN